MNHALPQAAAPIRLCAVVPVYNHPHAIGAVVAALRAAGLPCILVDDGSDAACAAVLDKLAGDDVDVLAHPYNQGKGAAVISGFRRAALLGYTHALQMDADGQHDAAALPAMIVAAQHRPGAVIAGYPVYDDSVPAVRLYCRYLTHIWVWINTLSLRIRDSMCGFRIYPLRPTLALLDRAHVGRRMDFDTEILVRLDWAGVPVINLPVRVRYPLDGISHYRMWHDNLLLTAMHARLFLGMLPRAPMLLWRLLRSGAR
ncbi:glycosyltransferase family 2 protein [Chitiniphilus eburneus]|uniref:Glycosyltransferase family 2 protein n=1 Tax=Chitiniphilus eburneus TaxID=2571148 RepID=A0A4U0PQW7_9NEIS|nr:glycosyltransferase family 2 protein [Chitiniphilus eburneus]TJZ70691.1 glycosyltransferase family 2 protein [Chitiniphilus eburneus]